MRNLRHRDARQLAQRDRTDSRTHVPHPLRFLEFLPTTIYSGTTWIMGITYNRKFINKSSPYIKKALPVHKRTPKSRAQEALPGEGGVGTPDTTSLIGGSILKDRPPPHSCTLKQTLRPRCTGSTEVLFVGSGMILLLEIGRIWGYGVGLSQIHKK